MLLGEPESFGWKIVPHQQPSNNSFGGGILQKQGA